MRSTSFRDPEANAPASPWRRRARQLYVVALLVAAATVLFVQRDRVADLVDGARPLPLFGALTLGLVSLLQSAWFWSTSLRRLGADVGIGRTLEANVAAIPARYVPGSIWYSAGRIAHLRRHGAPTATLGLVAVLETLLSFTVAVALGLGLVTADGSDDAGLRIVTLVGIAAVIAGAASPWALNPALRWVGRRRGVDRVPALRWTTYLELCGQLVLFWLTSAAAFVLYLSAFPEIDAAGVVRTAGTFLLAWAAGFLAVFAPQGAGVFESAMASTLDGAPFSALAVVIGGYRAVVAVRDVLALVGLALVRGRAGLRGENVTGSPGPRSSVD